MARAELKLIEDYVKKIILVMCAYTANNQIFNYDAAKLTLTKPLSPLCKISLHKDLDFFCTLPQHQRHFCSRVLIAKELK